MRTINDGIIEELLCRRVSAAIATVAPPGLGNWPRAWQAVAAADARFLELLSHYHGNDELAKRRVEEAGNDLVRAWKRVAKQWEQEGVA